MIESSINTILSALDLSGTRRIDAKVLWEETFSRLTYKSVAYSNSSLDYQLAYQQGHGGDWLDISLIIFWDNKPAALWPLSFSIKDGQSHLTSQGLPVLPPVFVENCPPISRKRIIKKCLDIINKIVITANISEWNSRENFDNKIGMSDWHIESMARHAVCHLNHEIFLNLQPDFAQIKACIRKSYKSLITAGERIWAVSTLDSNGSADVWQEFRDLHFKVSGRITRSDETWNLQYQDIKRQCAFLVWLRNSAGVMVGGGLFNYTNDEGLYAVGAYDRTLSNKPMGHIVQYRAIQELKKRGVIWYKVGVKPYISDIPKPSDKEVTIAEFKEGFASHIFPVYILKHKTRSY